MNNIEHLNIVSTMHNVLQIRNIQCWKEQGLNQLSSLYLLWLIHLGKTIKHKTMILNFPPPPNTYAQIVQTVTNVADIQIQAVNLDEESVRHSDPPPPFLTLVHRHPYTREFQEKLRHFDGNIRVRCRVHNKDNDNNNNPPFFLSFLLFPFLLFPLSRDDRRRIRRIRDSKWHHFDVEGHSVIRHRHCWRAWREMYVEEGGGLQGGGYENRFVSICYAWFKREAWFSHLVSRCIHRCLSIARRWQKLKYTRTTDACVILRGNRLERLDPIGLRV